MRRIGIVLGISLIVTLLGGAAFAFGGQLGGVSVQPVTFGTLQTIAAPPAPTHLQAVVQGSEIDLIWAASAGANTYNVYRGTGSHGEGTKPYVTGVVSLFFHNQQHIDPKTTYFYVVTAVSRAGQESAPSNEASATLTPPAPVTVAAHHPQSTAPNFLPVFILLGLVLLGLGGFLLMRSRQRPTPTAMGTRASRAPPIGEDWDPAASAYDRAPVLSHPTGTVPESFDPASRYDDAYDEPSGFFDTVGSSQQPPGPLPANASVSEGLVARFGTPAPEEVVADSGPLKALLPEPGDDPWYRDTGVVPGVTGQVPPFTYQGTSGTNPAWPVQRPKDYTATDDPDSRRTLLLVGAGASFVLGVMALFLFLFFNFIAGPGRTTTVAGGAPQPITTTAPAPTATALPSPTATVPPAPVIAINSGGSDAGAFSADADVSGGTATSFPDAVDTSGVQNPAPQAVYQTERYGEFTYTIPNLTPNASYTVRLHFAEMYFKNPGQRIFNVFINGQQVLNNFDIIAAAGAPDKAIVETFTAAANGSGQIGIDYRNGPQNNPKSSGIEIIPAG